MKLDNKEQQTIILQLIKSSTFTGASLDQMYKLKKAVEKAKIKETKNEKK